MLVGVGVVLWLGVRTSSIGTIAASNVIVQPFVVRSTDEGTADVAASFQDKLIQRLARVGTFSVFSGAADTSRSASPSYLLTGAVHPIAGQRHELSVRLQEARSGRLVWSQGFNVTAHGVPEALAVIADQVTQAVDIVLNPLVERLHARYPATAPEAWYAYLKGRAIGGTGNPRRIGEALSLYQQASQLDPEFALAQAFEGWSYYHLGNTGGMDMAAAVGNARAHARAALGLDPALTAAHLLDAWIKLYDRDFSGAETAMQRVVWDDADAFLRSQIYFYYTVCGRFDEALASVDRAISASAVPTAAQTDKAQILWYMKRFAAALEVIESVRAVRPNYWKAAVVHYWILRSLRRDAAAQALLAETVLRALPMSRAPASRQLFDVNFAHAVANGETPIPPSFAWRYYVPAYAESGNPRLAVDWLRKGYAQGDRNEVLFYRVDQNPGLEAMRQHPDYRRFIDETIGHPSTCPGS